MKQSSIEWLVSEIQRHIDAGYEFNPKHNEQLIDQAIEMHKQEIIEAYNEGYRVAEIDCGEFADKDISEFDNAIIYYKDTYETNT